MFKKIIALSISFCLIFEQSGFAQVAGQMHIPGYLATLMPAEIFNPVQLRAISIDPATEQLSLFLDPGDAKSARTGHPAAELYRYFQIGLRLPNSMFWVNLRPDSPHDIIDPYLEKTDVGRILLSADLQLKKDLALFTSPDRPEGKRYWDKLYAKAEELYGQADMEIPTLTRPWIVPGEIIIRESRGGAYIYKAGLQVMLEQDYLKDSPFYSISDPRQNEMNAYSSELLRLEILPKLTREVNSAKRYAQLRQVYYSLVLAQWFKQKSSVIARSEATKQSSPLLALTETIDSKDLSGLTARSAWSKDTYYNAYKKSFSEGEYKKEEQIPSSSGISVRTYFSGGIKIGTPLAFQIPANAGIAEFFNTVDMSATVPGAAVKEIRSKDGGIADIAEKDRIHKFRNIDNILAISLLASAFIVPLSIAGLAVYAKIFFPEAISTSLVFVYPVASLFGSLGVIEFRPMTNLMAGVLVERLVNKLEKEVNKRLKNIYRERSGNPEQLKQSVKESSDLILETALLARGVREEQAVTVLTSIVRNAELAYIAQAAIQGLGIIGAAAIASLLDIAIRNKQFLFRVEAIRQLTVLAEHISPAELQMLQDRVSLLREKVQAGSFEEEEVTELDMLVDAVDKSVPPWIVPPSMQSKDGGIAGLGPIVASSVFIGSMLGSTLFMRWLRGGHLEPADAVKILLFSVTLAFLGTFAIAGFSYQDMLGSLSVSLKDGGVNGVTPDVRERIANKLRSSKSWAELKEIKKGEIRIYPAYLGDQLLKDASLWVEFDAFLKKVNGLPPDFRFKNDDDRIILILKGLWGEKGKGALIQTANIFNKSQSWLQKRIKDSIEIQAAIAELQQTRKNIKSDQAKDGGTLNEEEQVVAAAITEYMLSTAAYQVLFSGGFSIKYWRDNIRSDFEFIFRRHLDRMIKRNETGRDRDLFESIAKKLEQKSINRKKVEKAVIAYFDAMSYAEMVELIEEHIAKNILDNEGKLLLREWIRSAIPVNFRQPTQNELDERAARKQRARDLLADAAALLRAANTLSVNNLSSIEFVEWLKNKLDAAGRLSRDNKQVPYVDNKRVQNLVSIIELLATEPVFRLKTGLTEEERTEFKALVRLLLLETRYLPSEYDVGLSGQLLYIESRDHISQFRAALDTFAYRIEEINARESPPQRVEMDARAQELVAMMLVDMAHEASFNSATAEQLKNRVLAELPLYMTLGKTMDREKDAAFYEEKIENFLNLVDLDSLLADIMAANNGKQDIKDWSLPRYISDNYAAYQRKKLLLDFSKEQAASENRASKDGGLTLEEFESEIAASKAGDRRGVLKGDTIFVVLTDGTEKKYKYDSLDDQVLTVVDRNDASISSIPRAQIKAIKLVNMLQFRFIDNWMNITLRQELAWGLGEYAENLLRLAMMRLRTYDPSEQVLKGLLEDLRTLWQSEAHTTAEIRNKQAKIEDMILGKIDEISKESEKQTVEKAIGIIESTLAGTDRKDGGVNRGGIDFRALPLNTQPGMNPGMIQPAIDLKALQVLAQRSTMQDLDKEWARIEKQVSGKAMPYEKMKEYLAVCCERRTSGEQLDRVAQCLSNILKLEEVCAVSTSTQMKELLLIVEAARTS